MIYGVADKCVKHENISPTQYIQIFLTILLLELYVFICKLTRSELSSLIQTFTWLVISLDTEDKCKMFSLILRVVKTFRKLSELLILWFEWGLYQKCNSINSHHLQRSMQKSLQFDTMQLKFSLNIFQVRSIVYNHHLIVNNFIFASVKKTALKILLLGFEL